MKTRSLLSVMVVGAALGLSGCASTPSEDGAVEVTDDAAQTKKEGAMYGALIGGLLGAAFGDDNRAEYAIVGAAIGAGAGYLVGDEIAKRKQQYATDEEFLDAEIASAQELNKTTRKYNADLEQEIARLDVETQRLKSEYEADRIAYSELDRERNKIRQKIEKNDLFLEDLEKEHEIKVTIYNERQRIRSAYDTELAQLETEIALLQDNINDLNKHSQQLASIDERLQR